ncbi:DUF3152 domain-containing protein [Micromonospora matsumotoense]|uniref:DUF3152 domain-containing protein n=1 Tax=Micromonospora matsumotoense TaxID=121616 RepID=UPI003D8E5CF6
MTRKATARSGRALIGRSAMALLVAGLLPGCGAPATADRGTTGRAGGTDRATAGPTTPSAAPPGPGMAAGSTPLVSGPAPISYPAAGGNRWQVAAGESAAPAGTGRLLRYRVAVERDIRGLPVAEFAAEVSATLTAPQGWTTGGTLRLWRVGPGGPADFTVHLATPGTRDDLCGDAADGYTSCRNGDRVVINVARWVKGVPRYGASLTTYRRYVVNHEVGHRLGHGHERCPGRGRPAPVMQQQTLGLHGCTANASPYRDGVRYAGPAGAYTDEIPPPEPGRQG